MFTGRRKGALLVLLLTAAVALSACDHPWPQFRYGAAHSGSSSDTGVALANLPGLVEKWSVPTGGPVASSPAVTGGIAYVGSDDRNLYAFDAVTGAPRWSASTNGAISSSPAVANGSVYVGSDDHTLSAYNAATGAHSWSVFVDSTFAGTSSAPVAVGSAIYVTSAQTVFSYAASTGALNWSVVAGSSSGLGAPSVANGLVYVTSYADARVSAYRADTGALAWSVTAPGSPAPQSCLSDTPSAAVGTSVVYAALCPTVGSNASLFAFRADTGAFVWGGTGNIASTSPAVGGGVVYVGSESGETLEAHDAANGALLWTAPTAGAVASSPALVNGIVYVGSDDHRLYGYDASGHTRCSGSPLVCQPLWAATTGGAVRSSPAVANGVVYAGSNDGSLYAYTLPRIAFGKSILQGTTSTNPTAAQFGPDGRLYVSQFDGLIKAYTVSRGGPNGYVVTATETIPLVQQIPNHDDDGTPNPAVTTRLLTGLLVVGSASNPVIYASSSDPRIGGGAEGTVTPVDTNSGVISRLTRTGGVWQRLDLVRGLPRSEENHATNALALDAASNTLYVAQGGNTNLGAPSHNFSGLPEYAYSGAVLRVDLGAIGNTTYDLPTLTDENHPTLTGPFGGDFGRHQARITTSSPVQVYAPGFRNPYGLVRTRAGKLYAVDNGSNAGWGDVPARAGTDGRCTNASQEPGVSSPDSLHLITGPGYYAGHANPTRGNRANTFNTTHPQSPVPVANPVECDPRAPGANGSISTFNTATTGAAEYLAGNFANQMNGDLLVADFYGSLKWVHLSSSGSAVVTNATLFSNVGTHPIGVTTQGDTGAFPGTIWVPDYADGTIYVFEPDDFGGIPAPPCTGAPSASLDEDGDGFTNADEVANHTDPCSAADQPHDWNHNSISDLNDPDDDSDGRPDTSDAFAIDPANGTTTQVPIAYSWKNGATGNPCAPTPQPSGCPGGLLGAGFTGLMTDGVTDYASLFDESKMTVGGAAGVLTVDQVPPGDATGPANTQRFAFQYGIDAKPDDVGVFTAHTRVVAPFAGLTPQGDQSMGLFVGTGDQDNFVKLVVTANGGAPGVQLVQEVGGVDTATPVAGEAMPGPDAVDLYLTIDPAASTVQAFYRVTTLATPGPLVPLGAAMAIPDAWLTNTTQGLAVGIIATSAGAPTFPATWDLLETTLGAPT